MDFPFVGFIITLIGLSILMLMYLEGVKNFTTYIPPSIITLIGIIVLSIGSVSPNYPTTHVQTCNCKCIHSK